MQRNRKLRYFEMDPSTRFILIYYFHAQHERAKDAARHPPGEKVNHLDVVPPSIKPDLHAPCEVMYLHK